MSSVELKRGYEHVHTVLDYYDGPRKGVADFDGQPHLYDCIFDALPHERERHKELQAILEKVLAIDPTRAVTRIGHFEAVVVE